MSDATPVGSQIAIAAGFNPDQQATVIQWRDKSLEDIGPNERIDLGNGDNRFIVSVRRIPFLRAVDGRGNI